jgi:hypothetical protein
VSAKSIAKLIGVLSSARTQFPNASLEYSKLQELKTNLVKDQGWEAEIRLNYSYLPELTKWTKLFKENSPRILPPAFSPHAILTTDASPSGWGAILNLLDFRSSSNFSYSYSYSSTVQTHLTSLPYSNSEFVKGSKVTNVPDLYASYFWTTMGQWSDVTASASSNKRELIACHKALESFSSILKKENCSDILILTDNTTAMYNINC